MDSAVQSDWGAGCCSPVPVVPVLQLGFLEVALRPDAPAASAPLSTEALLSVNVLAVAACTLLPVQRLNRDQEDPPGQDPPGRSTSGRRHTCQNVREEEEKPTCCYRCLVCISVSAVFRPPALTRRYPGSRRGRQGYGEMGVFPLDACLWTNHCPVL